MRDDTPILTGRVWMHWASGIQKSLLCILEFGWATDIIIQHCWRVFWCGVINKTPPAGLQWWAGQIMTNGQKWDELMNMSAWRGGMKVTAPAWGAQSLIGCDPHTTAPISCWCEVYSYCMCAHWSIIAPAGLICVAPSTQIMMGPQSGPAPVCYGLIMAVSGVWVAAEGDTCKCLQQHPQVSDPEDTGRDRVPYMYT